MIILPITVLRDMGPVPRGGSPRFSGYAEVMPLMVIPGSFAGWFGPAFLLWAAAAACGIAWRRGSGTLLPLLVGTGSSLLLLAAIAGGNGVVRLPLPWFLGAADIMGV